MAKILIDLLGARPAAEGVAQAKNYAFKLQSASPLSGIANTAHRRCPSFERPRLAMSLPCPTPEGLAMFSDGCPVYNRRDPTW